MVVSPRLPQAPPAARPATGQSTPAPIDLSAEQRRIVEHLAGGLLVLAPVGTGKTTVLAERLAHAVAEGIAPERALCLTFTNRAARAVRDRLARRFPDLAERLVVRTFHQLCADILRAEARDAGFAADFTICDDADTQALLRRILRAPDDAEARELGAAIARAKLGADIGAIGWPVDTSALYAALPNARQLGAALKYQRGLLQWQTLDFADLVLRARALLAHHPGARERWAARFDLVQVDEVQDTHVSEYEVVRALARRSGNFALFGDVDQTIYEWRGAEPAALLRAFDGDFAPVTRLELRENYRATRPLLAAASAFADSFERQTRVVAHPSCPDGEPIRLLTAPDETREAEQIARRVRALADAEGDRFAYRHVAVLARTNARCAEIAAAFERAGIPHVTAELAQLFRHPDVKDALAYLRLLANPEDTGAALRVWEQGTRDLGDGVLSRVRVAGEPIGLRLVDLFRPETFALGDPLGRVADAFARGTLVVFDVETTGLDTRHDEIVEIAAVRLERGDAVEQFHALSRPTVPVGESARTHGLTDVHLATERRDPASVLTDFLRFVGDDLVVGHNVGFDARILAAHAARLGLPVRDLVTEDTLRLAQRFVDAPSYALGALAEGLRLPHRPTHRAAADVRATADLLAHCMGRAVRTAAARRALVAREGVPFRALAEMVAGWRAAVLTTRPADLAARVVEESGLRSRCAGASEGVARLDELVHLAADRDDGTLPPREALRDLLEFAALARGLDHLDERHDRVPIVTIHQAKGLEFDTVFIPGVAHGVVPARFAVERGGEEEERRLFYVALTRARRRVFLSLSERAPWGGRRRPSPFLAPLTPWLARGA